MDSIARTLMTSSGVDLGRISEVTSPESLEYAAIKQEQQTRLVLRDTALYITVGGILTSASGSIVVAPSIALKFSVFLSFTAPMFSIAMFLIYFRNDYYLSAARRYILTDLGPRLFDHFALASGASLDDARIDRNFGWETYHRKPFIVWLMMRLVSTAVTLIIFLAPIAISFLYSISTSAEASSKFPTTLATAISLAILVGIARLAFFD